MLKHCDECCAAYLLFQNGTAKHLSGELECEVSDLRKYDCGRRLTSEKVSKQDVNRPANMTDPRVNAPAAVIGWLKYAAPMTRARIYIAAVSESKDGGQDVLTEDSV